MSRICIAALGLGMVVLAFGCFLTHAVSEDFYIGQKLVHLSIVLICIVAHGGFSDILTTRYFTSQHRPASTGVSSMFLFRSEQGVIVCLGLYVTTR